MKRLRFLIHAIPQTEFIRFAQLLKGQVKQLLKFIKEEKGKDVDAMNWMFPENEYSDIYYAKIKKKLFDRLISIILLSKEDESAHKKIRSESYKVFAAAHILIIRGKRSAATQLAEKQLSKTLKYQLTHLKVAFLDILTKHYNLIDYNAGKLSRYKKLLLAQQIIFEKEKRAEELFYQIRSKEISPEAANLSTFTAVKNDIGIASWKYNQLAWNIIITADEIQSKWLSSINNCHKAIEFFETKGDIQPASAIFSFYFRTLNPLIKIGDFDTFNKNVRHLSLIKNKGNYNKTIVDLYEIVSLFHQGDFDAPLDQLKTIKYRSEKYRQLHEIWQVLEAYAHFFSEQNNFRVARFVNNTPIFSKEKRGMNVNILIIQMLFMLKRKQYGRIIDRMEALERYASKYLRKNETFRSNCMIKMLAIATKCSFKKVCVERKTAEYLEKLRSHPITQFKTNIFEEPVPYEVVWERVLALLK